VAQICASPTDALAQEDLSDHLPTGFQSWVSQGSSWPNSELRSALGDVRC
jgi:hypothetical protein